MSNSKISLKDIARLSGVSIATVSRVINQNGRFSAETEKRVKAIIEEYNYQPNLMARSLRRNKNQVVGILVPDITNEFFALIAQSLQKELMEYDYISLICNTDESAEIEEEHLRMLKSQLVSGLVYISGKSSINAESDTNLPTVYIDRKPMVDYADSHYAYITSDNVNGGYLATTELIEKDCKKIAIVRFSKGLSTHEDRYKGYIKAHKDHGIKVDQNRVLLIDKISIEEGYKITKEIIESGLDIDGIFFTADILAIGALNYFNESKVRIPEDLKIIGFDDISLSSITIPKLSTIRQNVGEISKTAVETLIDMVRSDKQSDLEKKVAVELIVRSTT